ELVDQPETSLRALLNFLGEPYAPECLTPLRKRINSSNIPADFKLCSQGTDPALVEGAMRLYAKIETTAQPSEASPAAAKELEEVFNEQVQYVAALDSQYGKACSDYAKANARAERLAMELKHKRAFIQELRSSQRRHKLRRLFFGSHVGFALANLLDSAFSASCAD